jgi:cation-transporting ATPase F
MSNADATSWHQMDAEEVVQLLGTTLEHGLSLAEVRRRLEKFGPNRISSYRPTSGLKRFLLQFHQPLIYVLLVSTVVALGLREWVDASVIFGVVIVNALIGFFQETKAEKAIEALSQMVVTEATVRREGRKQRVPSEQLVPGDIVLLQSGDRVPADLRLYRVRSLQVDESLLTGESVPVEKHGRTLALETILADRKNLAFAGTLVNYGQAEGVTWATGDRTETGRIAGMLSETVELSTPLTRKIAHFSKLLMFVILALAAGTFAVGVWRGESAVEMFMAAVALAVGAIPEGLPAAVTVMLAIGVARMAKRRAIVRKLPAVEALGSTTVICSDKTGTLTENQMTVQAIYAGGKLYEVTGIGYEADGDIRCEGTSVDVSARGALSECLKAGLLCNDSALVVEGGRRKVQGDPTEAALIVSAEKGGLSGPDLSVHLPRLDTIPFESETQYMATLHHRGHRQDRIIYKKGALERLLEKCSAALADNGELVPLDNDKVHAVAEAMAARGLRVLAFASRLTLPDHTRLEHDHVSRELTFLGLQGMMDPPRREAILAVGRCQSAGIAVKMITGDHLCTARAVASQIGLGGGAAEPAAITGRELEECADDELPDLAQRTSVFARVAPEQKLRLVRALQSRDHIVAMTGDGVNDAPALKQADIGVAMGAGGTDVAKGAADIVLTDDNFASIEAAVEEGRGVFDNLTKFIVWTIPCNFGEGLTLLAAIFLGVTLPALPVQLLWVNMMTAIALGIPLIFEPKEQGLMQRPPRDPRRPILDFPLFMRTGLVSLIILGGGFGLFMWEQGARGASVAEARTIAVNVIVMVETFYLLNCRSLVRPFWSVGVFSNPWIFPGIASMIGLQIFFTYAPIMNRFFETAPIDVQSWLHITAVGVVALAVVGFEKSVRFRLSEKKQISCS